MFLVVPNVNAMDVVWGCRFMSLIGSCLELSAAVPYGKLFEAFS